jgi:hypothetical protein
MAARNKPAGIRSLVYGMDKSKGGIEGLSVSKCPFRGMSLENELSKTGLSKKAFLAASLRSLTESTW